MVVLDENGRQPFSFGPFIGFWAAFEGAIISGVKFAEKQVPDGTPNKGRARLDAALKYVLKVYEEAKGRKPSV
ncbi:MAG: hypothetical protein ACE5EY_05075, partial [Anaerolineae bacterium]